MIKKIKKNKKFAFKRKENTTVALLFLRKNHSNFFMTLTDWRGKVIICKTAASVLGKLERRRRRKAPQTMDVMIASFKKYLILYKIYGLSLILQMRPGQYLPHIIRSLRSRKIALFDIFNCRKVAYSYTRGRRKRR